MSDSAVVPDNSWTACDVVSVLRPKGWVYSVVSTASCANCGTCSIPWLCFLSCSRKHAAACALRVRLSLHCTCTVACCVKGGREKVIKCVGSCPARVSHRMTSSGVHREMTQTACSLAAPDQAACVLLSDLRAACCMPACCLSHSAIAKGSCRAMFFRRVVTQE